MVDLSFTVDSVAPGSNSAVPQLTFQLRIRDAQAEAPVTVRSMLLNTQIRIEPRRRRYDDTADQPGLCDLFGERARWGATMRSLLWTHVVTVVPEFTGETSVDLPVPCTFDFNVAATKYFDALDEGDIPLCFLFSGTVFYAAEVGLQAAQISWEKEANFRLPVAVWRQMIERFYPGSAWLCLPRDIFDELYDFKSRSALPTFEQALGRLLAQAAVHEAQG